ncbi:MAG: non-hydrolyzing UDP-N-acetylglucosamine 2-epimerase [Candidatus Nanopelagicales bacterium]
MTRSVVHVAGARPNFPKLAPVMRGLEARGLPQTLVHTGQHYDDAMSDAFFRDLELPTPDVNLGVGSGTHGQQTAALLVALEQTLASLAPSLVLVYGDINSTLAAAISAAKLHLPLGHVEAGLRSFDMTMPEEVNRLVTDRLSELLFVTSPEAVANLAREGAAPKSIHLVGNPMIDTLFRVRDRLDVALADEVGQAHGAYAVVTLHRPSNVDDPDDVRRLVELLAATSQRLHVVFPVHPRGRRALSDAGLDDLRNVTMTDPLPYLSFVGLVSGAALVMTDSGGIQEESTMLDVPCLTLRPNTERPVTISHGTNRLVTPETALAAVDDVVVGAWVGARERPPLWDGRAGERIAATVVEYLGQ